TPKFFSIECTSQRGHPCQIWLGSVDAFLFYRGVEISCFLYLAERPIQQCFALPCSAVLHQPLSLHLLALSDDTILRHSTVCCVRMASHLETSRLLFYRRLLTTISICSPSLSLGT